MKCPLFKVDNINENFLDVLNITFDNYEFIIEKNMLVVISKNLLNLRERERIKKKIVELLKTNV